MKIKNRFVKLEVVLLYVLIFVFITGCGMSRSFIPMTQEQLSGIYKVYNGNYALSGKEIIDESYFRICGDNAVCLNNKKMLEKEVSYIQVIGNRYCKILDTTTEEDEISAIERLQKLPKRTCLFRNNELLHDRYYKSGVALLGFRRNKSGDFIYSEFLTIQDSKVIDRKANFSDKKIVLYDKNGNKLLNKAYTSVFFPYETCDKVAVSEGFNYYTLPTKISANNTKWYINKTTAKDKDFEELAKGKFFLENKDSSKIKIFSPFGYIIEYGKFYLNGIPTKIYHLYDKDGNLIFDDLSKIIKVNNNRFYAQTVKQLSDKKYNVKTFLYDADKKSILFTADYMKPDNEINTRKEYDLISVIKDGKSGLIDFDGNIVVDYQDKYNIIRSHKGIVFDYNYRGMYQTKLLDLELKPIIEGVNNVYFKDNFFAAHLKDRIVIFNYSKKILHDFKADNIKFYDKFFIIKLKDESTLYDYDGNKLFNNTYNNLQSIDDNLFSYTLNGKTAVMDINAKEVIPPVCNSVKLNQCGIIECSMDKDNL